METIILKEVSKGWSDPQCCPFSIYSLSKLATCFTLLDRTIFYNHFQTHSHLHILSHWIYHSWNWHTRRICQNKFHLYCPSSYTHTVHRHTLHCCYRFLNCFLSCSKRPCLHCSPHLCYIHSVSQHVPRCT